MTQTLRVLVATLFLVPLTATPSALEQPDWIPERLRVPAGHEVLLRASAVGVQIYGCRATKNGGFEWVFRAPEAALFRGNVELTGTHYAGPNWQARDGSRVFGMRIESSDAPNPSSIPWLLLQAVSHEGSGIFSNVTYIQRLLTGGGVAPAPSTCDAAHEGDEARVEYIAAYYFYVEAPTTEK